MMFWVPTTQSALVSVTVYTVCPLKKPLMGKTNKGLTCQTPLDIDVDITAHHLQPLFPSSRAFPGAMVGSSLLSQFS